MRVGEANNLKIRDLELFEDDLGRRNYRFKVKGKTGERDVILRASARRRPACGADLAFLAHFHQLSFLPRLGRRFGEVGPVDFSGHRNRGSIQGFDES